MNWSVVIPGLIGAAGALVSVAVGFVLSWQRDKYFMDRRERREDKLRLAEHSEWVNQQWWQRKADAYTRIIDQVWRDFHDASSFLDFMHEAHEPAAEAPPQSKEDLAERSLNIKRAAGIGAFVISDDAAAALRAYVNNIDSIPGSVELYDVVETHYRAAKACLAAVRVAAIKDLGIDPGELSS